MPNLLKVYPKLDEKEKRSISYHMTGTFSTDPSLRGIGFYDKEKVISTLRRSHLYKENRNQSYGYYIDNLIYKLQEE